MAVIEPLSGRSDDRGWIVSWHGGQLVQASNEACEVLILTRNAVGDDDVVYGLDFLDRRHAARLLRGVQFVQIIQHKVLEPFTDGRRPARHYAIKHSPNLGPALQGKIFER